MFSNNTICRDSHHFRNEILPWLIVGIAFLLLVLPTLYGLSNTTWKTEEQGHGPIVLAISGWLFYKQRHEMLKIHCPEKPARMASPMLGCSLVIYIIGRSQDILAMEVLAVILVFVSLIATTVGWRAVSTQWFPVLFLFFMIPLPGSVVDALTLPMKIAVSHVVEALLYMIGYPIARSGVMLQIGPYKLLVADACAGLQTLFTLEALGLLYMHLVRHGSWLRNVILGLLIVPISFAANVIRVAVLSLITFHFGDDAGQGFMHGFAGMVLFVSALLLIVAVDSGLRVIVDLMTRLSGHHA